MHADITGCARDGLIVAAAGTRIDLNGHVVGGTNASGSAGIRVNGHDDVEVENTARFASVQNFEVGIRVANSRRFSVHNISTQEVRFGLRLEHSRNATITNNDLGFTEGATSCDPGSAPAGIRLFDAHGNAIRNNATQLTGYGILLIQSNGNTLRGNGAAPVGSDGNDCSGISLVGSDRNLVVANVVAENRSAFVHGGDGIFVNGASTGNIVKENNAVTNSDDGIDVENASTRIIDNVARRNDDLGIEAVPGVAARGNEASGNGNPLQCLYVTCT